MSLSRENRSMESSFGGDILPEGTALPVSSPCRARKLRARRPPRGRVATIHEESPEGVDLGRAPAWHQMCTVEELAQVTACEDVARAKDPACNAADEDFSCSLCPQDFSLPLSALLDLLSGEDDAEASSSAEGQALSNLTPCRSYSEFHLTTDEGVAPRSRSFSSVVPECDPCSSAGGAGATELDLSTSLAALLSILSVECDEDSTAVAQALTSSWDTAIHQARSQEEGASFEEGVAPSVSVSPMRLQRQSSLDSSLPGGFCQSLQEAKAPCAIASLGKSPSASLSPSPACSPFHPKMSLGLRSPSPVLARRMTGHRDTVIERCWESGPLVEPNEARTEGLKSVSEMIAEQGTAAFYRGFSSRSPMHHVKRSKRN